jgi:spermidine synthase
MKLYTVNLESDITYPNVTISSNSDILRMTVSEGVYIDDDDKYITKFIPQLVSMSFDSVLIGGLLLGLVPYYIQENKQYTKMTVVEKDINIINAVTELQVLGETVEIVNEDFLTYVPTQSYDLIISDVHWGSPSMEPNWESEIETLKSRYTNYLSTGGTLIVPLTKYTVTI